MEDFKPNHQYHFEFTGKGTEFFRIWIVNTLLSILTLGIYSAWAKVRTNQYFYGNTKLDDASFQYLADPIKILKGRLIAITLFISYYLLANFYPVYGLYFLIIGLLIIPLLFVLSQSFRMKNTAYRNITFNFHGKIKDSYKIFLIPFIAIIAINVISLTLLPLQEKLLETEETQTEHNTYNDSVQGTDNSSQQETDNKDANKNDNTRPSTNQGSMLSDEELEQLKQGGIALFILSLTLMLLFPVWQYLISRFQLDHTGYGETQFSFHSSIWQFYKMYLLLLLEVIAISIIFALCIAGLVSVLAEGFSTETFQENSGIVIIAIIGYLSIYLYLFAAYSSKHLNLVISSIRIDHIELSSSLTATGFFWLYLTNTILIGISLGLFIPWVRIRSARYRLENIQLFMEQDLNQFTSRQQGDSSAIGEEVGTLFDIDVGL